MPFPITETAPEPSVRAVSAITLRRWCSPKVILAVITSPLDELLLLPHVIWQARQSDAKIVLAHFATRHEKSRAAQRAQSAESTYAVDAARATLERMARQLRWLGVACDPVVVKRNPEVEIPSIAEAFSADRVLVGFEAGLDLTKDGANTVVHELLTNAAVPTCVVGRAVGSQNIRLPRNIALAVSLDSDCDVALGFASRLAQEQRANLTILHVVQPKAKESGIESRASTSLAVASRLPAPTWREAELLCPTAIEVREGDVAEAILEHAVSTSQDLILLCSAGSGSSGKSWRASVGYRVLSGAECPVFVLPKESGAASLTTDRSLNWEMMPARRHDVHSTGRKEIA